MDYKFWFAVGSQHLYGSEVFDAVAERAEKMAEFFNNSDESTDRRRKL